MEDWIFHLQVRGTCRLLTDLSLALGVKMNVLLTLPGLLVVLFQNRGFFGTLDSLIIIAMVQIGLPAFNFFESEQNMRAYYSSAFDFSRQFLYKWTVNWKFIPEERFLSPKFGRTLLVGQVLVLIAFGLYRWSPIPGGVQAVLSRGLHNMRSLFKPAVLPGQLSSERESEVETEAEGRYSASVVHVQPHWHDICALTALPISRMVLSPTPIPALPWRFMASTATSVS